MPRTIDRQALEALAGLSVSRADLVAAGYLNLAKSGELFPYGYSVSFWFCPSKPGSELLEYNPRTVYGQPKSDLPRVTARCYEDQAALHRALGLGVTGRGQPWRKYEDESPGLFDHLEG